MAFHDDPGASSEREAPGVRESRTRRGSGPGPPWVICPRRGHGRGHLRMSISQTPLSCVLMRVRVTRDGSRNTLAPLRFGRILPNRSLRFGRRVGLGATPLRTSDLQPSNPDLCKPFCYLSGVAPSPRLRRDGSLREGQEPATPWAKPAAGSLPARRNGYGIWVAVRSCRCVGPRRALPHASLPALPWA